MPEWVIKSDSGSYWNDVKGWLNGPVGQTIYSDEETLATALPVGGSWVELKQREKPVCSTCGSDDVRCDAWAIWHIEKQEWVLDTAFDKPAFCEKCGGECSMEWVEAE